MTDDLVKRLRDWLLSRPSPNGRTFHPTHEEVLIAESERRIEQLEADLEKHAAFIVKHDLWEVFVAALGEKKDVSL